MRRPLAWLAGLLLLYLVLPLGALVLQVARGSWEVASPGAIFSALGLSAASATITSVILALFGIPLGHALAASRSRLSRAVSVAVHLPLAMPPLASGILLVLVIGPYTALGRLFGGALTDSLAGIVAAQTFVAAPFLVLAARSAFESVPAGVEDVAATLGHRPLARWWRFVLPLAWPGVRAGLLLAWVRAFGEFGATAVVAYNPHSLPVLTWVDFGSAGLPATMPLVLISAVAAALFVAASQTLGTARRRGGAASAAGGARRGAKGVRGAREEARMPGGSGAAGRWPRSASDGAASAGHREDRHAPRVDVDLRRSLPGFTLRAAFRTDARRIVVLGPSGAGKSMLLRILAGIEPQDAGRARFEGRDLLALAPEGRRVGYVPQEGVLFPNLTVRENVLGSARPDPEAARFWLARLGIADLAERYPDELSGGQAQRAALCRALAARPSLLLLDEPLSALDAPVREELRRELRRLQAETDLVTIVVSHDPADAAVLADEAVVLAEGGVIAAGPPAELLARPGSADVARILGLRNVFRGTVTRPGRVACGSLEVEVGEGAAGGPAASRPGDVVEWLVDPRGVRLVPVEDAAGEGAVLSGTVVALLPLPTGLEVEVRIEPAGPNLIVRPGDAGDAAGSEGPRGVPRAHLVEGRRVGVVIRRDAVQLLS